MLAGVTRAATLDERAGVDVGNGTDAGVGLSVSPVAEAARTSIFAAENAWATDGVSAIECIRLKEKPVSMRAATISRMSVMPMPLLRSNLLAGCSCWSERIGRGVDGAFAGGDGGESKSR